MNKQEAIELLTGELAQWRKKSHAELATLIGAEHHTDVQGASGTMYQLEVQVFWDDEPGDNIRVLASIDDGSFFRAVLPMTDDFILGPDGTFVGEDR